MEKPPEEKALITAKTGKRLLWIAGILAGMLAAGALTLYALLARYDVNALKPRIQEAVLEATGRKLVLGGDMEVKIGLRPSLLVRDVRLANAEWGSAPDMVAMERLEVQVVLVPLLSGDLQVSRLVLVRPDILVETGPGGRTNLAMTPKEPGTDPAPSSPDETGVRFPALTVCDLRIQDASLTYRDGGTGRSWSVSVPDAQARSASSRSPMTLELTGRAGRTEFRITGSLGSIQSLADSTEAWPVDLAVEGAGVRIGLSGNIRDPLAFRGLSLGLSGRLDAPDELNQALGRRLPVETPFTVTARLNDPSARVYALEDMDIRHGRSHLTGSCTIGLAGPRPSVSLDLTSDLLDLGRVTEALDAEGVSTAHETSGGAGRNTDRVFPADPLPVDALRSVDALVSLQAGEVILPWALFMDVRIGVELKNGRLTMDPFQAATGEGRIQGRVRAEAVPSGLKTTLALQADDVDLEGLAGGFQGGDRLSGRLRAGMDLQGEGRSIAAVMAGLDGKIRLAVSNGTLDDRYLELLGSDLSAGILRLLNPVKDTGETVQVNCLISMLEIHRGLAKIAVLVFDTPTMTVRGGGDIDLRTEALNVALDPRPKEGLDTAVGGRLSLSLGELTKNFRLGGTLARPKLALDPTQTMTTIAKGLGGMLLLGPAGLAGALASTAEEDGDPCLSALDLLEKEQAAFPSGEPQDPDSRPEPGPVEKGGQAIQDAVKGVQDSLKKLFGD